MELHGFAADLQTSSVLCDWPWPVALPFLSSNAAVEVYSMLQQFSCVFSLDISASNRTCLRIYFKIFQAHVNSHHDSYRIVTTYLTCSYVFLRDSSSSYSVYGLYDQLVWQGEMPSAWGT